MTAEFELRVVGIDDSVLGVRSLELAHADRAPLPAFGPGSHITVHCGERRNSYSLTGDVRRRDVYQISVAERPDGGGSAWMHALVTGSSVQVTTPRNHFAPVAAARHSVYIAGGIGITPLLSHLREAVRHGRGFDVVYATRAGVRPAHLDDVTTLAGGRLRHVHGRRELLAAVTEVLDDQPIGTYVYVCGPPGLTAAVLEVARDLGWPDERLRFEPFAAAPGEPGQPFTVELVHRDLAFEVPADSSLLVELLARGVEITNLCRQGVCGECLVPVHAGTIDHRDYYLAAEERADGRYMMACVSRAAPGLELDL